MKEKYEILFSPFTIRGLTLKNRLIMPPMGTGFATAFGAVTSRLIAYHRARATGGVGINIVENTAVEARGKLNRQMLGIYDDDHIPGLASLAEAVHSAGGKIAIQLGHVGRRAASTLNGGWRPWAPSSIPELGGETPNEMVPSQIDYIQDCYRQAARRAKAAGFDAVEMHAAHGYLVHQFLSPLSNKRSDRYGGSLENRARFALETLACIRKEVGDDFPVFCRISADEFIQGGSDLSEATAFARLLEKGGADVIDISAGVLESAERTVPPMAVDHGCNVEFAEEIKKSTSLPVICVGRIKTLEEAETILRKKSADLIAMGRALIADPDLPQKTLAGGVVRPCIGCNQGCIDRLYQGLTLTCLVNARAGREDQIPRLTKTRKTKKIAVIGGGPAGMEFARVAAERGHQVTLYEKEKELGGNFRLATLPPKKGEISDFLQYLTRSIRDLGVITKTGTAIAPEDLCQMNAFDEIVIAVGGVPICLPLQVAKSGVVLAEDVLQDKVSLGPKVVVIGGGMVGSETAEWIAHKGKEVIIVEMMGEIARDMESRTRKLLMRRLEACKVEMLCNTRVECIEKNKVICCEGGLRFEIGGVDSVVLALGYRAAPFALPAEPERIHKIGDCVQPRKALEAIHEGFLLGVEI